MSPETTGLLCSGAILLPTLVWVALRVRRDRVESGQFWVRWIYEIRYNGHYYDEGSSYRYSAHEDASDVGREILGDYFARSETSYATRPLYTIRVRPAGSDFWHCEVGF